MLLIILSFAVLVASLAFFILTILRVITEHRMLKRGNIETIEITWLRTKITFQKKA